MRHAEETQAQHRHYSSVFPLSHGRTRPTKSAVHTEMFTYSLHVDGIEVGTATITNKYSRNKQKKRLIYNHYITVVNKGHLFAPTWTGENIFPKEKSLPAPPATKLLDSKTLHAAECSRQSGSKSNAIKSYNQIILSTSLGLFCMITHNSK